jgi:hypothetical protein
MERVGSLWISGLGLRMFEVVFMEASDGERDVG